MAFAIHWHESAMVVHVSPSWAPRPPPSPSHPSGSSQCTSPEHLSHASNLDWWSKSHMIIFKLVLEKAEEPEIKLTISAGSSKKQESSKKTSISALLTTPKPLTVWSTINCGKFWRRWEYQTTWPASWETYIQVRKQQLELDMEQQTGSNRKRGMSRWYIVTLLI